MYSAVCSNGECRECTVVRNKHTSEEFTVFFWEWSPEWLQVAALVPGRAISKEGAAKAFRVNEEFMAQHFELLPACPHCGNTAEPEDWYEPLAANESKTRVLPFSLPAPYPQTPDGYLLWREARMNPGRRISC